MELGSKLRFEHVEHLEVEALVCPHPSPGRLPQKEQELELVFLASEGCCISTSSSSAGTSGIGTSVASG